MKYISHILFFVVLSMLSDCSPNQGKKLDFSNDIQPYAKNLKYWQHKGEPVLLLGASNNDNLFQAPDVEEQLDLLQAVGGNYVRNTMVTVSGGLGHPWPFYRQLDGKYDLEKWNAEYWKRFEKLLKLADERDIFVQIEIWDRFDYSRDAWLKNPLNPVNNINYTVVESGLAPEYPKHPALDLLPFFHSIKGMPNYSPRLELVKKYQEKFVKKILSYSLNYGNVLYCMDNETSTPSEWGKYWMGYIKNRAGSKQVYTTDMFDNFFKPKSCKSCLEEIINTKEYTFLDISQVNSRNFNQAHWNTLQWIINERNKYPIRPINCVKIYGGGYKAWGTGGLEDGIERFWRNIIGGCAGVRFHRPTSGNGLNDRAQASIKAARLLESVIKFWDIEPHMELLKDRNPNEAYLAAKPGEQYMLYFTYGGSVGLDLSDSKGTFTLKWISVTEGKWLGKEETIEGGNIVTITAPFKGGWVAAIVKK